MDKWSPIRGLVVALMLGLTGCASNGAIVDPLVWWENDDPQDLAQYGPTPVQRIEALDALAARAGGLSTAERATESEKIAKALTNEPNVVIRVHMVRALGKLKSAEAVAGLKSALFDPEADVRREAVVSLGESKSPEAVALLGDVLIRDRDYDVQLTAASALGEFGTKEANEALIPALDARDPAMRFAAIESLRRTSKVDYQGDTAKWREFALGGSPVAPQTSIAEQLVPGFLR